MNSEKISKGLLLAASFIILLITTGMVLSLVSGSIPVFKEFGIKFIFSSEWNPTEGREDYGALAFIAGTIITSVLALLIALPLAFSTSLFIGEYFRGKWFAKVLGTLVDLLAGVPSIVYGLWGFYVLRPFIVDLGLSSQGYGIQWHQRYCRPGHKYSVQRKYGVP